MPRRDQIELKQNGVHTFHQLLVLRKPIRHRLLWL